MGPRWEGGAFVLLDDGAVCWVLAVEGFRAAAWAEASFCFLAVGGEVAERFLFVN